MKLAIQFSAVELPQWQSVVMPMAVI